MLKVDAGLSAKFANISFVGAVLVVCHHFSGGGFGRIVLWWIGSLLSQGDMAHGRVPLLLIMGLVAVVPAGR